MPIWNLTMEKKDEILKQQNQKGEELRLLREKSKETLWLDDLEEFSAALDKLEAKEKEDETVSQAKSFKASKAHAASTNSKSSKNQSKLAEYLPDPTGERVEPVLDEKQSKLKSDGAAKVKTEKKDELNSVDVIIGNHKISENEIIEHAKRMAKPPPKETIDKYNSQKQQQINQQLYRLLK